MKKLYLLLIFLIFAIPQVKSQSTEDFETMTAGSTSFTSGGKTFNLSSTYGFVVANIANTGYDKTPKFIHVNDPSGAYGQAGIITAASGTFKINSFWFFVSGDSSYAPSVTLGNGPGSITFIGKLSGNTVFTVVRNTLGGNTGNALPGNGFTLINFAGEGGSDNTNQVIDQLEIHLSSNYDYFAIDNFTFTNIVAPTITTHPSSKTICSGITTSFSVTALNATSYQWQVNTGQGFGNISDNANYSGTTSSALSITGATSAFNGYQYRCVATGSGSVNSNPATLTVPVELSSNVSANTPSAYGQNNGSATVSVSGGTTSYYYSWAPAGGSAATASGLAPGNYTVSIWDSTQTGAEGCSKTQSVTIAESPGASTSVPSLSGFTTCAGSNSVYQSFILKAGQLTSTLDLSSPTGYEVSTAPNGTYAANLSITPSSGNINTTIYVRLATTATGTPTGNLAVSSTGIPTKNVALSGTVTPLPVITAQPSTSTICAGANTIFTSTAANATGYQWEVDQGTGFAPITIGAPYSGITTNTLTITGATAGMNGYLYRLIASNTCPTVATSSSAELRVNSAPIIIGQPSSTLTCSGGNASFSITASNATGYQWQVDDGGGFESVPNGAPYSGNTSATLTITGATAAMNGYLYRAIATGSCTPLAVSNTALLTINSAPTIVGQPSASTTCQGADATFSVTAANATGYQWQEDQGQGAGFLDITNAAPYSGTTTATLIITGVSNAFNGYKYRVVASGVCNPQTTSNGVSLTVNPLPAITADPLSTSVCSGSNTTFSVSAENTTEYQWQVDKGDGAGFADVLNAAPYSDVTTATLTITGAPVEFNGYKYRAVATGTCTPSATSNSATLTVNHITIIMSKIDVACFGASTGTATASPSGGSGNYTYSWSNGGDTATITGLAAGITYTVTVTDENLCSNTASVTLGQPPALTTTAGAIENVSCYGGANGTATVIASGGTGAGTYTYSWDTTPNQTTAKAIGLTAGTYIVTVTDANSCQTTRSFTVGQSPAIVTSIGNQTNVSCNGGTNGTATVNVTGGTGANTYTYQWTPTGGTGATASGLAEGTYTVTVTDGNNCTATQDFTITEPPALSATQSQTEALCNGSATGTATVTASGGSGHYTYSWSPSGGTGATATGLIADTYTCLIRDENLCSITVSFTITQPNDPLDATTSQINATCSTGGQASVSAFGGTAGYSYLWSPSGATTPTVTGLAAGLHSCVITDANGCSITRNFTISTTNTLVASTAQVDILCNGSNTGSASVVPSGAPGPFNYVWSPNVSASDTASNLIAGNYSVTISASNGCSIVKNFTISEPSALTITPGPQTNVTCNGGNNGSLSATVAGGTGAYVYSWAPSGGNAATATGLSAGNYTLTVTDANFCEKTQSFTITQPDALTATTSKTDVSCNGGTNGTATVDVTGGTGTYTYSWSPSGGTNATASGLSAGNYTVTIKDANLCETTATVLIEQPALLTATTSKTDVLCNQANNGTATVTPSGGTGTYTYSWSPSGGTAATATDLAPNTYTVTVTDSNGCFVTETIEITEPDALSATDTHTNVSCKSGNNGSASVIASGGTGNYSYLWAPSGGTAATATALAAGTYTVTITDQNSCSITNTIEITEPDALDLTATVVDVSCHNGNNGSVTVNVTGGTGSYTYAWAPSGGNSATATGLSVGTYTVTVTDANLCEKTQSFTITQPDALTATTSKTDVSCNGDSNGTATVDVTGGTGTYTYSWLPSGGTSATASGLSAGTYTVTVKDANLCETTATVLIEEPTLLTATTSKTDVLCNQANNGTATVTASGGTGTYTYSWSPSGGTAATATDLAPNTYTVTVTDSNGCFITQTIEITEPNVLSLNATSVPVSCHNGSNGSATVTVAGGTGTYSYSWSPSGGNTSTATNLAAGTYMVTVTDANSCSVSLSIDITQPDNPVNLNTASITGITTTSASLSGTASSDGINTDKGECLIEVGFVYAQHASPTTADTKISVTAELGTFTNSLSGLRGNKTYYVRTYAVNSNGFVNYGNEVSFTTEKYTLTITAAAGHTKVYGTADPVFNYTALGFVNGDTNSILTGLLSRDAGENVGKYSIKLGSISAGADYIIEFTGAEFEITKADQTITWNQTLEFGCLDSDNVILTATANSGLPISYTLANTALGTISGSTLNITGSGNSTITATQIGDQNHNEATAVIKPIEISQSGLVVQQWANVLFFDNKSNNFVAWQWYKNGTAVSGATRQYYSEVLPLNGTYYVIAKDKNGNSIKSCPIETTGTVFTKKIKIYPNPVKPGAQFTLECDFSDSQLNGSEVVIYDITGKLVQTISNVKAKNEITAPSQVALYIVVLKLADGQLKTINLLVK